MNGRLYDPVMARFMSADFLIPDAGDLQSYNRYTYVINNPLAYTDASGQCPWCIGAIIGAVIAGAQSHWDIGAMVKGAIIGGITAGVGNSVNTAASAWAGGGMTGGIIGGIAGGAAGGFVGTFAATGGDFNTSWSAALSGAFSGGLAGGMQIQFGNEWNPQRVFAESVAGGVKSALTGGRFGDGFKAAAAMSGFTYLNYSMRKEMVAQSKLANNHNGEGKLSAGFFGDGNHMAGSRHDAVDGSCASPMGGCQNPIPGTEDQKPVFAGRIPTQPSSMGDVINEAHAGPHDWLRNLTGSYDANGNARHFEGGRATWDNIKNYALVIPAMPLAVAGMAMTIPHVRESLDTARR